MHGNRDFMLGMEFARQTNAKILFDPSLIYVGRESVLISHGDYLCTDDVSYQRFRTIVRSTWFKRFYDSVPFSFKHKLAVTARDRSKRSLNHKPPEITDVNQNAVENALRDYSVTTMIHGHTHRPAVHIFDLNGKPAKRIVLGDWYTSGSVLRWSLDGPTLTTIDF